MAHSIWYNSSRGASGTFNSIWYLQQLRGSIWYLQKYNRKSSAVWGHPRIRNLLVVVRMAHSIWF